MAEAEERSMLGVDVTMVCNLDAKNPFFLGTDHATIGQAWHSGKEGA